MMDASVKRSFQRAKRGMARVREADQLVLESKQREQEMAKQRVRDVEDWIKIVSTRTRAIELLKKFSRDREVAAFLEEVK
jgi:hypothetical protein